MAVFRYEAVDKSGKLVRGAMNAANEQAVAQRLSAMGYALKSIVPSAAYTQSTRAAAVRQPKAQSEVPVSIESCVRLRHLARFYRQLATLVRAGMPLIQSLNELQRATKHWKLRRICGEMAGKVQMGTSLSSAMAAYPRVFPAHTVGIIWAGELGGYLDVALEEAATELEQEAKDRLWGSVGWWIAKANILFLILLIPVWNVEQFFVDVATISTKQSVGNELASVNIQQASKIVFQTYKKGFLHLSVPTFIGWVIFAYTWGYLKRVPSIRRVLDSGLLLVPLWGPLHRARARERFLKTLFRLYNASVAPAQAWAAASVTVRNSDIARKLRRMSDYFRQPNTTLYDTLVSSNVFSPEDSNLVKTAETAGSVPEMLERMADYHMDVVSGSKIKGRLTAMTLLNLPIIILTGWLIIKFVVAFYKIGAKFGELG
ncbi:MAG: type II secretion system F family protein [Armatimonadota bacterium]